MPSAAPRDPRRWYLTLAAAATLIVTGGAIWRTRAERSAHGQADAAAAAPMRDYRTTRGQRAEILLADGSRVLLSVESRLRVPTTYGAASRDVHLEGEAYFDVRHEAARPFRVHTPRALAEDLGTSFVVREYAADARPIVVVASGAVTLAAARAAAAGAAPVTLTPGQLGEVDERGSVRVRGNVDVQRYLGWTHGRIELKKVTLAEAARELERWYDVEISIADSGLARATLSASFENQPLIEVLDIVAGSLGAGYERNGSAIRFTPERGGR